MFFIVCFFQLAALRDDKSGVDVGVAVGVTLAAVVVTVASAVAVFFWRR